MGSGRHAIPLYATRGVVAKAADGCGRRRRTPHRSCGAQRHQRRYLRLVPRQPVDCLPARGRRQAATGEDEARGGRGGDTSCRRRSVGRQPLHCAVVRRGRLDRLPITGRHFDDLSRWQYSSHTDRANWIAYQSPEGISMISPDGNTVRILTGRKLSGFAFSKDGNRSYGIFRNRTGEGAQWQLYSIDVKTGAEKMLAPIDLPASAGNILGFSLHPDGKRFLTSVSKWPFDIWMLEGWDQPQKTWLDRLLRR